MALSEYVLEMVDICKQFPGVKALDNVQLRLRAGSVHALMGENGAGKSTLMKCLFGVYIEDGGSIFLDGKQVRFDNPKQALMSGVSMVHQELNQVLKMSVYENIWLGRYLARGPMISEKVMIQKTKEIFESLEIDVDPKIQIGKLSVSQRQMVEIAKAVSYNAKILVLDEPTSSLTEKEVEHLFKIIRRLRSDGCAIIYISHKMEEILKISDEVTIMRDGKWVETTAAAELTTDKIISLMVGRTLDHRFPPKTNKPGEVVLEVSGFTAEYQKVTDVNFNLRKGEILGIAGLVGAGRTELLEMLFGIARVKQGEVMLYGKKIVNNTANGAISNGFAMLTEERRATGVFAGLSVKINAIIANLSNYCKFGVVNDKKCAEGANWVIDSMSVKTPSQNTPMRSLSGGNQQKVILGRWLLTRPEVLLLDEPTRGIDVGAKYEIYQLMVDLACEGKSIIIVSSEMPELLGISDRIAVMSNGRIAGVENTSELTQEDILRMAAKYI